MAIIENRTTEYGDVLYIQTNTPVVGIIALTDFVDTTVGETAGKFFYKEFRYTQDGINYSAWAELTNNNISQIQTNERDTFIIEYRYTRVGSDNSGEVEFDNVTVNGHYVAVDNSTVYNNSIFAKFLTQNDVEVLNWAINVLEKIYEKGITPEFVERGLNPSDDKDFIDLFRTTTTFYAYIVVYARRFLNLDNSIALRQFLTQKGIYFDYTNFTEMKYLKENFYKEMTLRGTLGMLSKTKTEQKPVFGEVLRLINYKEGEEFIFALLEPKFNSWTIDNVSPCWSGLNNQPMLNKSWEDTESVVDLTKYPLAGLPVLHQYTSDISVLSATANQGIAFDSSTLKLIPVSYFLNYSINFKIVQLTDTTAFTFGVDCYDENGNVVQIYTTNPVGVYSSNFFANTNIQKIVNKPIYVQGIIFHYEKLNFLDFENDTALNIGKGRCLRFSDKVKFICPRIIVTTGSAYIYDIKVRPYNTVFQESGVIDSQNNVKVFTKINNPQITKEDFVNIMKRYFINYNCNLLKLSELSQKQYELPILFDEFDFLVIRYTIFVTSGRDLDTVTCFVDTGKIELDNKTVGFAGNSTPSRYYVTNSTTKYLQWGGDNQGTTGSEAVLVDFNKLHTDYTDLLKSTVRIAAHWWGAILSGEVVVEMTTYKGGTMTQPPMSTDFINVGGEQVNSTSFIKICTMQARHDPTRMGQELGKIEYNPFSKTAKLIES